jgi:hypothetical protein
MLALAQTALDDGGEPAPWETAPDSPDCVLWWWLLELAWW